MFPPSLQDERRKETLRKRGKVLLVDDDVVTVSLLSHCLQELGYEVTAVSDGLAARRLFRIHRFPMVITDWEMPGLDGLELCREIRNLKLPSYTYIIMLTSRHERRHLIEGLSAGADDFVSKPFDPDEIRAHLHTSERILSLEAQLLDANQRLRLMNRRLRRTSRLDPLMEIGNRMAFEEELVAFHGQAMRRGEEYGLVMCDVDHFKRFNDRFGHQKGDEILRQVAAGIRQSIRAQDSAFRYGGEEVLILLQGQNLERSMAAAERVRRQVGQLEFQPDSGAPCRITVSCGVASCPQNLDPARGWRSIVECADRALYQAKNAGRNRVAAFSADHAEPASRPADGPQGGPSAAPILHPSSRLP